MLYISPYCKVPKIPPGGIFIIQDGVRHLGLDKKRNKTIQVENTGNLIEHNSTEIQFYIFFVLCTFL